jgi:hypothetical protein
MTTPGKVVSQGKFRVDRKKALEKMERFQLEDPHRYVLEWVAAAVSGGATRIDIYNDADDFRISWAGTRLSGEELDALFDYLWGSAEETHAAVLQHLGLGVLGALGLQPRWVHLDSGADEHDLRLAVTDPAQTRHVALSSREVDGVRCHVREQLNATTVREALTAMFQEPAEARLIQGAARWCPVPVWINGKRIPAAEPPDGVILSWSAPSGRLWATVGEGGPVDLLRHGLMVGHLPLQLGPFHVGGWWRDDGLKLNASRSQIVHDEHWQKVAEQLGLELDRGLREELPAALAEAGSDEIAWRGEGDRGRLKFRASRQELLLRLAAEAVTRLCRRKSELGALREVPLLQDVSGNPWKLAELFRLGKKVGVAERAFEDPELDHVVFMGTHAQVLRSAWPEVADLTETLEKRAEGRRRRAQAAEKPKQPVFEGSWPQHTFREGPLSGAVRHDVAGRKQDSVRVHVRIDRVPLCVVEVDSPAGTLEAILDHPGFLADAAFNDVVRDSTWKQAVAVLQRESLELLYQIMQGAPQEGLYLLSDLVGHARKAHQLVFEAELDPRFANLPLLPTGAGPISVAQLAERREGQTFWVVSALPPGCPAELAPWVLVLPEGLHARWLRWLGPHGRSGTDELRARIERARRMAQPLQTAKLKGPHLLKLQVRGSLLKGEIGLRWVPTTGPAQPAEIVVLRAGVDVCVMRFALALPGVVGVVDGESLEVSPAHDALAQPKALMRQLEPFVDELALAWLDQLQRLEPPEPLPGPLLAWLAERHEHADLGTRPIVYTLGGTPLSLEELSAKKGKRAPKLRVVRMEADGLPGFGDALRHTPELEKLLQAVASGRWRDATDEVKQVSKDLEAFLARPAWTEPRAIVRRNLAEAGWTGMAMLPLGDELGATRVTVLWRGRVLVSRLSQQLDGVSLVVSGDALGPNRVFNDLEDGRALGRLETRAAELLLPLLGQALEEISVPARLADSWLQLAGRLHTRRGHPAVDKLFSLPLLRRLAGAPLSLEELEQRAERHPVLRVTSAVPEGPVDDGTWLRDGPGLEGLLEKVLQEVVPLGDERLLQWRKGEERKKRLVRQEPRVKSDLPVLARESLQDRGEVALLGAGSGLQLQALVDGLPLQPLTLDCPVPAAAVIQGPGVRADREFLKPEDSGPWRKRVEEVREAVHRLVATRLSAFRPGTDDPAWAWAWLLAEPRRRPSELDAPVFPLADGTWTTLRELSVRHKRDGAITVIGIRAPAPRGPQPVFVDPNLRDLLGRRFPLEDLTHRRLLHPPTALLPGDKPRKGEMAVGDLGITLSVGGWQTGRLPCPGPLPLQGHVEDDSLAPDPLWKTVAEDPARQALLSWLGERSKETLTLMAQRGQHPDQLLAALVRLIEGRPAVLRSTTDPVLVALRAAPLFQDSQGQRLSLDQLLKYDVIRAVPPGSQGEALPGSPPFVCLDARQQAWLKALGKVRESSAELALETRGAQRRRAAPWIKPVPPKRAVSWQQDGVQATVWFGSGGPPRILVDRREVAPLDEVPPELTGWIEGPFETDVSFERATLPGWVGDKLVAAVVSLLQAEERPANFTRVAQARGRDSLQELLKRQPWWREVALFDDVSGRPVTLKALLGAIKKGKVLWDSPGTEVEADATVLAASFTEIEWLGRLLPDIQPQHYSDIARARTARQQKREKSTTSRKVRTELVELVRSLGPEAVAKGAEGAVDRWLSLEISPGDTDRERLLLAWKLASTLLHEGGAPRTELEVLVQVARRL